MLKDIPFVAGICEGICERCFLLRILPEEALRFGGQRTKATVGGVPPISLVCLSQWHECDG